MIVSMSPKSYSDGRLNSTSSVRTEFLVGQDDPLEEMDRNLEGWDLLALQTPMEDKRDPTAVWVSGGVVDVSAMWKV